MTAINPGTVATHSSGTGSQAQLLRFALRADATACAGIGLLVAMAADPLSQLSGLSATAEWFMGAVLVVYGAMLYLAAGAPRIRRIGVGVLIGNIVFAAGVVAALAAGWLPLTGFGVAATLAFAVVAVGFACLQYLGVRLLA